MSSSPSRYPRYHLLDPLRGVAIGCVLASHFTAPGVAASTFHDLVVPTTRHGYLGVALFFVISGYCIAGAAAVMLLATGLSAMVAGYTNPDPFAWTGSLPRPLIDALAVGAALLLITIHGADEKLCRWPAVALLGWVGTISYSLYLTHSLVGVRVMNVGMRLTGLNGLWWPVFCLAALVVSLAAGVVFFRYCEKPWMNFPSAEGKAR